MNLCKFISIIHDIQIKSNEKKKKNQNFSTTFKHINFVFRKFLV